MFGSLHYDVMSGSLYSIFLLSNTYYLLIQVGFNEDASVYPTSRPREAVNNPSKVLFIENSG